MNWLQKIAQIAVDKLVPPTYTDIGHGYEYTQEGRKEKWQLGKSWSALLWWFENDQIITEPRTKNNTAHWLENCPAQGRVDIDDGVGSITFSFPNRGREEVIDPQITAKKRRIINMLLEKFPGIRFYVYGNGAPVDLEHYMESL